MPIINIMMWFLVVYPVTMSIFWIVGSIFHQFRSERDIQLDGLQKIALFIPCYNEENTIDTVINEVLKYGDLLHEIIIIDNGSSDTTWSKINTLSYLDPRIHILQTEGNTGKANALNTALDYTTSDYIVCIDADALIEKNTIKNLVGFFKNSPTLGAVTGNPRVKNTYNMLAKLQLIEYASTIGLIKRAQRFMGRVMTVSGVAVAFRKKALVEVGGWSENIITEDIDVTWKLYRSDWDIDYNPDALVYIFVPEKVILLLKQRKRWSRGGFEVVRKNLWFTISNRSPLFFLLLDSILCALWTILFFGTLVFSVFQQNSFLALLIWFSISGFFLTFLNVIQILVSLHFDKKYVNNIYALLYLIPIFSVFYWILQYTATLPSIPYLFRKINKDKATWTSPDRGRDIS